MTATAIAPVQKTVRVKAPIAHTFEVFTNGLARWWPPNVASACSSIGSAANAYHTPTSTSPG
jgi:hypothetical protein